MDQQTALRVMSLLVQGFGALQQGDWSTAATAFGAARAIVGATPGNHAVLLGRLDEISAAGRNGDVKGLQNALAQVVPIIGQAVGDQAVLMAALHAESKKFGAETEARAMALLHQGQQAQRDGDFPKAIGLMSQALEISRPASGENDIFSSTILSALGAAHSAARDWRASAEASRQALTVKERYFGKGHVLTACDLTNLSVATEKLGELARARELAEAAVAILRQHPASQTAGLPVSLNGLATAASSQGDLAAAVSACREALARARGASAADFNALGLDRDLLIATILDNFGLVLGRLGDQGDAITHHLDALMLRRAKLPARHPDIGRNLMHLGSAAVRDGDLAQAAGYYRQALDIFSAQGPAGVLDRAACLRNMAVLALNEDRTRIAESREHLTAALAAVHKDFGENHPFVLACQNDLASTYFWEGGLAQAGGLARDVLRRAAPPGLESLRQQAWSLLSMLADRENQPASAILFGKLAVNAIQRQRALLQSLERDLQDSFLDRHSAVFRNTAAFLAKAGRIAEAGRVIKMLKEYELFELLRRDPALDPRLTFAELTALEAKWQRRGDEIATILASVSEEMAALESGTAMGAADLADLTARQEAAIKDFDAWLRDAENACAAAHPAAPPVKMGGVELAPRTALLQILPGANNLHLLLTGEKFQIGREVAVGEAVLNRLIHEFRVAIEHRAEGVAPLGKVLYNHLIAPVEAACAGGGIETLLISPVGSLRYLPFAALHDGTRYLAETMATVLFTEAAADNRAVMAAPRETNLAGFGVTREWPGFRALHAVADELARIVRDRDAASGILPGQVWLDDAFTANSLAAGLASHRAIHVASHFVFEPEAASGSYLLLGDGQHLGLTELADEKFRFSGVDLMTLSACETAMGEQAGDGSEVEGLGALVRRRGANSVVATLWPVEDASTPVLMERFYRSRAQSAMDAQALRTAQMQMLEGGGAFAHPYHWAPFIVLGGAP